MKDSLLLHACCARCFLGAVVEFQTDGFQEADITVYFDNSNIHPRTEWLARLDAIKKAVNEYEIKLVVADWSPRKWFQAIECNPDNSNLRRCIACWEQRIGDTAAKAAELGVNRFSTTLLSSRYQSRDDIENLAKTKEQDALKFVSYPLPKREIKPRSIYLQNYCGCCYSLTDRYEEKQCR